MKTLTAIILALCSPIALPAQSDAIRQFEQSAYESSLHGAKDLQAPVDVWIIPMPGIPSAYLSDLVARLKSDTKLVIRSSVEAGFSDDILLPESKQLNGELVLKQMGSPISHLYDTKATTVYILISPVDLNESSGTKRFLFSLNDSRAKRAVVSIARMRLNQDGTEEAPILTKIRLFKMVKKQIGEMYYGYARSNDINSVMYSPIMSIDDLDMISTEFPK